MATFPMIIDENLRKLIHLNDPIPNDLNLRIADKQASIELLVNGSSNKQSNNNKFLVMFDDDRCSNDCVSNIDIHCYLLIITDISIGVDELSNHHLLVLLLKMFILFFIIVANDSIVTISIIISKQVEVLFMMNILLQFQQAIVIILRLLQGSNPIFDSRMDVILFIDSCHDISILVHHSIVDDLVNAYIHALT